MQSVCTLMDEVIHLALSGSINFSSRKVLAELIQGELAQGRLAFMLDLSNVSFIDSSGLGALVACLTTVHKQGGRLVLVNVPAHVQSLLEMTKLTDFFPIYGSSEDALLGLQS